MSLFVLDEAIVAYNETLQNMSERQLEKYNWDSAKGKRSYIEHCRDYIKMHYKQDVSKTEIAEAIRDSPDLDAAMPRSLYTSAPFDTDMQAIDLELGEVQLRESDSADTGSVTVGCLDSVQQTVDSITNPRDELQSEVAIAIYDEVLRVQELIRTELDKQIEEQGYMQYSCAERDTFYAVLPSVSYQSVAEECIFDEIKMDYSYARSQANPQIPYFTQFSSYTPQNDSIQMASFYFRFIGDPRTV